jgi:uncharacterized protein (TIGR02145 family)
MKTILLFTVSLMVVFTSIQSQNYQISFTASGSASSIDSIYVENLTQGTTLMLNEDDVLHLVVNVGIHSFTENQSNLFMYPNPMTESTLIEFNSSVSGQLEVEIFSMNGTLIAKQSLSAQYGLNQIEISNLQTGLYTVMLSSADRQVSAKLISMSSSKGKPVIRILSREQVFDSGDLKSTKNLVQMQYNDGERILFKAYSGSYKRVSTLLPTQNQTVDFHFIPCTDSEGNHYAVVTIGLQTWMAENLKYLPGVVGPGTGSETIPYYYVYGYNGTDVTAAKATSNFTTYGVLYNWPAAMAGSASSATNPSGVQGVCPAGWHLPSDAEWTQLTDYLGGESVAGGKLKETGTAHWNSPNTGATNETGFTALPGGYRDINGTFLSIGHHGFWWSATENYATNAWYRFMFYNYSNVVRLYGSKELGFSVRCVRD